MPDAMGFGSEMFYPYNNAMFYGAAIAVVTGTGVFVWVIRRIIKQVD